MIAAGQRLLGRSAGGLLRQQRQFAVLAAADDGMFFLFLTVTGLKISRRSYIFSGRPLNLIYIRPSVTLLCINT